MSKKENKFSGYDITTQAVHIGTDYDAETGAVCRPLHIIKEIDISVRFAM